MASWSDSMVIILREIVGDNEAILRYSDDRLIDILISAASIVVDTVSFSTPYIIDVTLQTISPDPVIEIGDKNFVVLTILKAAVIIAVAEYRSAAKMAISHRDGPSSIDTHFVADNLKVISSDAQKTYTDTELKYKLSGTVGIGILSVYNGFDFNSMHWKPSDSSRS